MFIRVLFAIMICIVIFASGFYTGYNILCSKIYDAMIEALHSVSVEKDGADYVLGVMHVCKKVDEVIDEKNKEG